jgi:hypothetical protein
MTLEQFRATKQWCDDLVAKLQDQVFIIGRDEIEPTPCGFVYLDCLFIEKVLPNWPEATRARGGWHLLINRSDWISDDLAKLEAILFEWASGEGYEIPAGSANGGQP